MLEARLMTWTGKVGVVEMSELYNHDMKITEFQVHSSKTDNVRLFKYSKAVYSGIGEDREIIAWVYVCDDLEIHILND